MEQIKLPDNMKIDTYANKRPKESILDAVINFINKYDRGTIASCSIENFSNGFNGFSNPFRSGVTYMQTTNKSFEILT